jgi:hypothetical protein
MIVCWRCFERRGCRSSAGFELPVQVELRSETGTSPKCSLEARHGGYQGQSRHRADVAQTGAVDPTRTWSRFGPAIGPRSNYARHLFASIITGSERCGRRGKGR